MEINYDNSEIIIKSIGSAPYTSVNQISNPKNNANIAQAIRDLWVSAKFRSESAVVAMPSSAIYTKWLHIEAEDEEELERTVMASAIRGAPFPVTDAVIDYRILSTKRLGSHYVYFVMLAAASSQAIDQLFNIVESAGLEPIAVDIAPAAALRSFERQKKAAGQLWSDQPLAHCIVGANETNIMVIRGDLLEFSRTVNVGGNDITECIANHLDVRWSEADKIKMSPGVKLNPNGILVVHNSDGIINIPCENVVGRLAREIHRSLKFFSSQFAERSYLGMVGAVTLSGGGVLLNGLDDCLSAQNLDVAGNNQSVFRDFLLRLRLGEFKMLVSKHQLIQLLLV